MCLTGCTKQCHICPKLANFLVHLFQVGLAWCTIGIYHFAISNFLEPHHLQKASNHLVISKLMHHFYLQCPSHEHFDPWDVEPLLFLLESWALASSLPTFKLVLKTATLLALITAKHCSDLTLSCIDNQHLFLQCHAAIFIPVSGGKTDQISQVIFHLRFTLSLIPILIFAFFIICRLFDMY